MMWQQRQFIVISSEDDFLFLSIIFTRKGRDYGVALRFICDIIKIKCKIFFEINSLELPLIKLIYKLPGVFCRKRLRLCEVTKYFKCIANSIKFWNLRFLVVVVLKIKRYYLYLLITMSLQYKPFPAIQTINKYGHFYSSAEFNNCRREWRIKEFRVYGVNF